MRALVAIALGAACAIVIALAIFGAGLGLYTATHPTIALCGPAIILHRMRDL